MANLPSELGKFIGKMERIIPGLRRDEVKSFSQGWENSVFIARDSLVFKFPRTPEVRSKLWVEKQHTDAVRGFINVELPEMELELDSTGKSVLFAYYPKLSGMHIHREDLGSIDIATISAGFVRLLTEMGSIPNNVTRPLRVISADAEHLRMNYREMLSDFCNFCHSYVQEDIIEKVKDRFHRFLTLPLNRYKPGFVHNDISDTNVLFSTHDGGLCGIIDWGDSGMGDPAMDLAGIRYYFGDSVYREVIRSLPYFDEDAEIRARFYCSIVGIYRIEYGIMSRQPRVIRDGVSELSEGLGKAEYEFW